MKEYIELESQSKKLLNEMIKKNSINSPKKMFREWKRTRCMFNKEDFEPFIDRIRSYIGSVELKLNDDLINEKITSLWLIKNELDQYLD